VSVRTAGLNCAAGLSTLDLGSGLGGSGGTEEISDLEISDLTELSPSATQLSMRRRNSTCARPIDRSTIIAIENRGRGDLMRDAQLTRSFISKEGGAANHASLKQSCVSSFRLPVEVP
jgi:hypothetical protein